MSLKVGVLTFFISSHSPINLVFATFQGPDSDGHPLLTTSGQVKCPKWAQNGPNESSMAHLMRGFRCVGFCVRQSSWVVPGPPTHFTPQKDAMSHHE